MKAKAMPGYFQAKPPDPGFIGLKRASVSVTYVRDLGFPWTSDKYFAQCAICRSGAGVFGRIGDARVPVHGHCLPKRKKRK